MNAYIIAMDTVAAVTLGALATGLVMVALHAPRGPYRALSLGGAIVCLLLATSSLHRLLVVAARAGLLSSHWADWLLGPIAAIEATLAVLVGVSAGRRPDLPAAGRRIRHQRRVGLQGSQPKDLGARNMISAPPPL